MTNSKHYDHLKIEKKWQDFWKENKTFKAKQNSDKPSFYALDMFPYPSGAGLHVGHPLGQTATDIISRKKRQQGYNVLHPMGWDAFGLPAENYAIKTGIHPKISTYENVDNFRRQIQSLGMSYDWDREFATTDEDYYRWSQWLFLQFYKQGLLYEDKKPMNWCPSCKVVCANEEVENGLHERCGTPVEKKALRQWMFEITKYADRLLADLDKPNVVIIHGFESAPENNWFPDAKAILEEGGLEVFVPKMPDSFHPKYEAWKIHFEENVKPRLRRNSILIGHSLGGGFIQKYLSENDLQVGEVVLVAPTVSNSGISEIDNFFQTDFDYEKIKNSADNIFIFASTNDQFIKNSEIEFLGEKLDAKKIILEDRGHLMDPDFPEFYDYLRNNVLGSVLDWPDKITAMQKNWIGKSEGVEIDFDLEDGSEKLRVYTTRPDTLFGVTYFVLSPEHALVSQITTEENKAAVEDYQKQCAAKSELERTELNKEKTGVFTGSYVINPINGEKVPVWIADYVLISYGTGAVMAVPAHDERDHEFAQKYDLEIREVVDGLENPFAKEGGVIKNSEFLNGLDIKSAVEKAIEFLEDNQHGERVNNYKLRDWIFTRQRYWGEPIPLIHCEDCGVVPHDPEFAKYDNKKGERPSVISKVTASSPISEKILASQALVVNRKPERNLDFSDQTIEHPQIGKILISRKNIGEHFRNKPQKERTFRLKFFDLVVAEIKNISHWITYKKSFVGHFTYKNLVFCAVVKDEKLLTYYHVRSVSKTWKDLKQNYTLPLTLPETANYEPSDSGESPLAKIEEWVNCECPKCEKPAKRETSTMPNWAGSNWYWLRFMDPKNEKNFVSLEAEKQWGPVDLYVGGAEHAVLHLLYSRFWHKALYDKGLVHTKEPFKKLVNQGLILAEGGVKMSKSLGNVVNPDDIVQEFGADTLRMYEMFMGPFEQSKAWDSGAVGGTRKFLDKIWRFMSGTEFVEKTDEVLLPVIHQTIKQVTEHIDEFKFNTAISQLMICFNTLGKNPQISVEDAKKIVLLISPFAPHLAEEIWSEILGEKESLAYASWPEFEEKYLVENNITYGIQVNGKVRGEVKLAKNTPKEDALAAAKAEEKVAKYLADGNVVKEIFVPGKIIGFVVK